MFIMTRAWDKEKIPDRNRTHDLPVSQQDNVLLPFWLLGFGFWRKGFCIRPILHLRSYNTGSDWFSNYFSALF